MTRLTVVSALLVSLCYAALAHEGHEHATGAVRERMELMTDMGKRLLVISKRLRTNKELDRIAPDARAIRDASGKITSQFPPGSTQSPTAAKPVVWQQWDDFGQKAKKLQTEAEKCQRRAHLTETHSATNSGLLLMHATAVSKPIESPRETTDEDIRFASYSCCSGIVRAEPGGSTT